MVEGKQKVFSTKFNVNTLPKKKKMHFLCTTALSKLMWINNFKNQD